MNKFDPIYMRDIKVRSEEIQKSLNLLMKREAAVIELYYLD